MDERDRKETLLEFNLALFARMQKILDAEGLPYELGGKEAKLLHVADPSYEIDIRDLRKNPAIQTLIRIFGTTPQVKSFELPAIFLDAWNMKHPRRMVTSPMGSLPEVITAGDGNVYRIKNGYFLNSHGQAIKQELASSLNMDQEKFAQEKGYTPMQIQEVPERGGRFVPLNEEDYEFIAGILYQIESGEFTRESI